jgi:hypothetical protein
MGTLLVRLGAGLCAAASTGAVIGAGIALFSLVVDPGARTPSTLLLIPLGAVYGAILGCIPAAIVISFTRARKAPWRSILILIAGASVGFVCGLLLIDTLGLWSWGFAVPLLGATMGGALTAPLMKRG